MLNVILKERFDYKNLKDMIKINLTKEYLLHDTIKTKTKQKVGYNQIVKDSFHLLSWGDTRP